MPGASRSLWATFSRLCSIRTRIMRLRHRGQVLVLQVAGRHARAPSRPLPPRLIRSPPAKTSISWRLALLRDVPHDEVPRQADALHRHAQPAGQLHVQHRQRDGQALAVVDHLGQVAVGAVVVVAAAAVKALLAEQEAIQRRQLLLLRRPGRQAAASPCGHALDLVAVGVHVQLVVVQPGDQQGRMDEIDVRILGLEQRAPGRRAPRADAGPAPVAAAAPPAAPAAGPPRAGRPAWPACRPAASSADSRPRPAVGAMPASALRDLPPAARRRR